MKRHKRKFKKPNQPVSRKNAQAVIAASKDLAEPLCESEGLELVPNEMHEYSVRDSRVKQAVEKLIEEFNGQGTTSRLQERLWELFHPEACGILNSEAEQQVSLRARRLVEIDELNSGPIEDVSKEVLFTANALLTLPRVDHFEGENPRPPEQMLFDLQVQQLDASKKMVSRQRQPRVFVFGQLGYGNPALDFFRDEFRSFYIVGAGMHWTVWDWRKSGREEEAIAIQQEIIRSRKDAFDQGLSIQNEKYFSEIRKYEEAAERDREIV